MHLKLPAKQTVIAPLQTRVVPLFIDQSAPFVDEVIEFDILLKSGLLVEKLSLSIPITHQFLTSLGRRALKGTFVWAGSSASTFLAMPPTFDNAEQSPPILALRECLPMNCGSSTIILTVPLRWCRCRYHCSRFLGTIAPYPQIQLDYCTDRRNILGQNITPS